MTNSLLFLTIQLAFCIHVTAPPSAELEKGMSALCRQGRAQDEQLLLTMPTDIVVPALVDALQHDPRFSEPFVRYRSYQILSLRRAAERPEGFEQLLRGAMEIAGRSDAITGLARAPADKRPLVVKLFRELLADPKLGTPERLALLGTARQLGPAASELVPAVRKHWLDQTAPLSLRSAAVECIFELSESSTMNDLFQELHNDSDRVAAVCATLQFAGRRGMNVGGDPQLRTLVRAAAVAVAEKESGEMRLTALTCLLAATPSNAVDSGDQLTADERTSIQRVLQAIQTGDANKGNRLLAEQAMERVSAIPNR